MADQCAIEVPNRWARERADEEYHLVSRDLSLIPLRTRGLTSIWKPTGQRSMASFESGPRTLCRL